MSSDDDDAGAPKDPGDYAVGFGKPPKHTQFQPGRSGNPKGKQKGQRSPKETVRAVFEERIKVQTPTGSKRMSKLEALLHTSMNKALKGDARASEMIFKLAREYGLQDEVADAMNLATMNALNEDDRAILDRYRNADDA